MAQKIICVDIDGTICTTPRGNYTKARPIRENIEKVNELYDLGNLIYYWTSRGNSSGIDWRDLTMKQLQSWGCKFDGLFMGKKSYDMIIDDKARRIEEI